MEHYLVAIGVTAGIYALMALGMNVIWGMAGLINLGLVGFFAVGAYVSGLLTLKLGLPIVVGMAAGALAAALFGVLVALVTVRLRGDYMAIVTLGFAETLRVVMSNELWIANGTDGLSGIPGPFRGALGPHLFNLFYLGIVVAAVVVLFFLVDRLANARSGACCAPSATTSRSRRWRARTLSFSRSKPSASAPQRWGSPARSTAISRATSRRTCLRRC